MLRFFLTRAAAPQAVWYADDLALRVPWRRRQTIELLGMQLLPVLVGRVAANFVAGLVLDPDLVF